MDKKVCKHCNVEKDIEEFPQYQAKGKKAYRNVCRDCLNAQFRNADSRRRRKKNPQQDFPVKEVLPKPTQSVTKPMSNSLDLTSTQKYNLIKLLDNTDKILDSLNSKVNITFNENKANRSIRSINLDDNLYELIKEKSKEKNVSVSDFLNAVIKKGIDFF